MKKTIFLVVMATLCLFFRVQAQTNSVRVKGDVLSPVNVGDKVPDMEFSSVYNYNSTSLKLSDFKGKAILLDFWGVWCSGCVSATSKVQEFQNAYEKNLTVLLIDDANTDTPEILREFLARRKSDGLEVTLPIVLRPETTRTIFPHRAFPHYGTRLQHRAGESKGMLSDRSALILSVLFDGGISYLLMRGIRALRGEEGQQVDYNTAAYKEAFSAMQRSLRQDVPEVPKKGYEADERQQSRGTGPFHSR